MHKGSENAGKHDGRLHKPWFALGWTPGALTGWGQYGVGLARSLALAGLEVVLPSGVDAAGVGPIDLHGLRQAVRTALPDDRPGWLLLPLGNDLAAKPDGIPSHVGVCGLAVFEDAGALDVHAVQRLRTYDQLIAPSRWVASMLAAAGLPDVPVCHQGYDARVFAAAAPAPSASPPRPLVFSAGKLEYRKGQDITIDAFRRFRATPAGRDAMLVCAWDNPWPQTMDGIWLSGYVKGVPRMIAGRADICNWLGLNGIPPEAVIDCGQLTAPELAHVMRSCTIGVFPSRAEGATNMLLVEALASGLPCIASAGHGHEDVPLRGTERVKSSGPCPSGCRLYRATAGWTEASPAMVAELLVQSSGPSGSSGPHCESDVMATAFDWSVRGPALADVCLNAAG